MLRIYLLALVLMSFPAMADPPQTWNAAKTTANNEVYAGITQTFYCQCPYIKTGPGKPGGKVDVDACGYVPSSKYEKRAHVLEWEHVVPASLMPARQFDCWVNGSRSNCEKNDPQARAMIFDLHNLVPAVGQMNALRTDDRYGIIDGEERNFGACEAEDKKGLFEPADKQRGDVARIWLYMHDQHGVVISDEEKIMFTEWSEQDPASAWERERNRRIFKIQGNANPYVETLH